MMKDIDIAITFSLVKPCSRGFLRILLPLTQAIPVVVPLCHGTDLCLAARGRVHYATRSSPYTPADATSCGFAARGEREAVRVWLLPGRMPKRCACVERQHAG